MILRQKELVAYVSTDFAFKYQVVSSRVKTISSLMEESINIGCLFLKRKYCKFTFNFQQC